jgi:hypothetical protein
VSWTGPELRRFPFLASFKSWRWGTIALLLAVSAAWGLSSCSGESPAASNDTSPSPVATPPTTTTQPAIPAVPSPSATAPATSKANLTQILESGLQGELSKQLENTPIQAISCPNIEKIEPGKGFECWATIAEGTFPINVTMTSAEGGVQLKTKQLVVLSKVEAWLQQGIKEKSDMNYQADCPGKILLVTSEQTLTCKLTDPNGGTKTATVTIKDESNIRARWEK